MDTVIRPPSSERPQGALGSSSLAALRDFFCEKRILIGFNAPVSRPLVSEIGLALRQHVEATPERPAAAIDVFTVYIEMSQNILNYSAAQGYADTDATATIVIAEGSDGRYLVSAGNVVEMENGIELVQRVEFLSRLDDQKLKCLYKEQRRQPRGQGVSTGAGLGLIVMARTAKGSLSCGLDPLEGGKAFFTLCARI